MPHLFGSLAALLAGLSLLSISSVGLVALGRLKGVVANSLAFVIIAYATIVLLTQNLSELYLVSWLGFLIGHALIVLLVLPLSFKLLRAQFAARPQLWGRVKLRWQQPLTAYPALLLLGLWLTIFMLVGLFLLLVVPPNTYDSLWYHLTRVAYWLHNHTLHHFQTADLIKTTHQGYNGEMGLLWLTALWGTDQLTALVQWLATIFSMVAIYGIARQLRFSPPASLFAALIWGTFTIVVAQSTSTKNDLLVAFFVVAAFYFLLAGLCEVNQPYQAKLILFGLALGLALGTKPIAFMVGPGLVVMACLLLWLKFGYYWPKLLYAALWGMIGLVLVGSYNYALNWSESRSFFGPAEVSGEHLIAAPSVTAWESNLGRMGYSFFDPGGLPKPWIEMIQQWRPWVGQSVFSLLHIELNPPGTNFEAYVFDFKRDEQLVARDEGSWYGPLGFLLFLPALFFYLLFAPKDIWKWSTAFVAFSFILIFALFVRWQPWMGRMVLIAVTVAAPLMAGFYQWSEKYKLLRWLAILVAGVVLSWSATHNYHRPLLGSRNIWNLDYYSLRTFRNPSRAPVHRYLDGIVPDDARLGVAGNRIALRWTYLFFGPALKRDVVELGELPPQIDQRLFDDYHLDYLVLTSEAPQAITSVAPLWPVVSGDERWFLVKYSEIELFTTQQRDGYQAAFGADYAAYLDLKKALDHETQPVRVLTTDPRIPYYEADRRFVFDLPGALDDLKGFTHLLVAPGWSAEDYKRFNISWEKMQTFLTQDKFVKKITQVNGYTLYRLLKVSQ